MIIVANVPCFMTGQIELYSHLPVMRAIVDRLQQWDYRVCSVYILDSVFIRLVIASYLETSDPLKLTLEP